MSHARGLIEYDKGEGASVTKPKGKASAAFSYQRPRNDDLYIVPDNCNERSCLNFRATPRPRDTYFLCPACTKSAPNAYAAGYARLPLNWPKMKQRERDDWSRKTNATVLSVMLRVMLRKTLASQPAPSTPAHP